MSPVAEQPLTVPSGTSSGGLRDCADTGDKTRRRGGGGEPENAQVAGVSVGSQIDRNSRKKKNISWDSEGGRGALLTRSSRDAAWF